MRHDDARGWGEGVIANDISKTRISYRISKFMNCPLLKNPF